jgi:hypothetical protein
MRPITTEEVLKFNRCNANKLTQENTFVVKYGGCIGDYKTSTGFISEKWYFKKPIYKAIKDPMVKKIISNYKKGLVKNIDNIDLFTKHYVLDYSKDFITIDFLQNLNSMSNKQIIDGNFHINRYYFFLQP